MATSLLNLTGAPNDPIERVMWLTGVMRQAETELEAALGKAYFEARTQGRLDAAISAGSVSRKKALALTRRENNRRGRMIRWGDGVDPTSTAYSRSD